MENVIVDFVRHIFGSHMMWGCWRTNRSHAYTAIDTKNGLLVKLRLMHPDKFSNGWPQRERANVRDYGEPFDFEKHYHRFELEITDPACRWGRKTIVRIYTVPTDGFYSLLLELYKKIRGTARLIVHEHAYETRLEALREAIDAITTPTDNVTH